MSLLTILLSNTNKSEIIQNNIPGCNQNHEVQKKAMEYVSYIVSAIKRTDFNKAIEGLAMLNTIDYEKVSSPLSLLYDLVHGIEYGREDFLVLSFKNILFIHLKKIAQGVFVSVIKNRQFVSNKTKHQTLKKLKSLKMNLNPSKEPCVNCINNLDYTIKVVEILPQNSSVLWDSFKFMYKAILVITKKDTEAFKYIIETLRNKKNDFFNHSFLNQATFVNALCFSIYRGQINLFQDLIDIYKNTKLTMVKFQIINFFGDICINYYSGNLNNSFANIAFDSFKQLILIINSKKISILDIFGMLKCGAAENMILLENRLQDTNAKKTVSRYLSEIKNINNTKSNRFFKIINSNSTFNKNLLCVVNNKEQIYNMYMLKEHIEKATIKTNPERELKILQEIIKNQKKIISILENKN